METNSTLVVGFGTFPMMANRWLASLLGVSALGWWTIGMVHPKGHENESQPTQLHGPDYLSNGLPSTETTQARRIEPIRIATPLDPAKTERCPIDMVEIEGDHCQVVEQICKEYISEKRDRCARYHNQVRCLGKAKRISVCIDRYEYPNRAGEKPTVAVTFVEAAELCAADGKRLCTADEWTQACEGPAHLPYPYGFVRSDESCNHDKPYRIPNDNAYKNLATRAIEVARLDQSEPSGSRTACVSSYGVFDMTGNVDEWVKNESGSFNGPAYESGLKGGYWGPVRNRCRPMTTDHNRWHSGYQIGLRCCSDPDNAIDTAKIPRAENSRNTDAPSPESVQDISRS